MKKFLLFSIVILLAVSLIGCSKRYLETPEEKPVSRPAEKNNVEATDQRLPYVVDQPVQTENE